MGNGSNTAALHLAITKHESPELVKLLCHHGARVDYESQVQAARVDAVPSHALHHDSCAIGAHIHCNGRPFSRP